MNILKDILYFVFSIQERVLTGKLNKTLKARNTAKRKRYYGDGCLLSLDSIADAEKERMEEELLLILKSTNYEPLQILDYIAKHDTKVFYIDNPKALYSIGENEGFIYPQKGAKALYLSLLTEKKMHIKTAEMFILSKGEINKFYFVYHFYNWYAYKHGISGMDAESLEMLNKYLFNATDDDINKLQLSEIYKLKDAIKQDKSSIEFVFKLCRNLEGAQKALDKLKNTGADV